LVDELFFPCDQSRAVLKELGIGCVEFFQIVRDCLTDDAVLATIQHHRKLPLTPTVGLKAHWLIPPEPFLSYDEYLRATGENAVLKARAMSPEQIVTEVLASGLRGRGGAGFPTGVKWRTLARHACPTRYVVCNAAEGEPGTFKDRYLLRRNPYATLEGMLIAAHVVHAAGSYIALKGTFGPSIERVQQAITEIAAKGLMDGIEINVVEGPEEYLFGEEKALLNVVEGSLPMPREAHNPPYEIGLFATPGAPNPALVDNAKTLAHIPSIIRHGGASFLSLGTHDTPGTLLFTVCGDVCRPGVYEREAGITLRELFHVVAGGPRAGRTFKAALSGVSTGVIPAGKFDTRAEFDALEMIGSGLGSAGFIVLDDTANIPRVTQTVARFLYVESCNQCPACKAGLRIASQELDRLFALDEVKELDLEWIAQGAHSAPQANRCFLPAQGARLIPSLIQAFREEFEQHTAGHVPPSEPWPIPKIVDYDEQEHRFYYDEKQMNKNSDWTYSMPPAG
jgi:NADH:ubiquinone oxidoreductase subunit F (NADH-binding)